MAAVPGRAGGRPAGAVAGAAALRGDVGPSYGRDCVAPIPKPPAPGGFPAPPAVAVLPATPARKAPRERKATRATPAA